MKIIKTHKFSQQEIDTNTGDHIFYGNIRVKIFLPNGGSSREDALRSAYDVLGDAVDILNEKSYSFPSNGFDASIGTIN